MENQHSPSKTVTGSRHPLEFKAPPGAHSGNDKNGFPYKWIKAMTIPLSIVLVIGSFAILSGRNRNKPADWVYIHAINGKKDVILPDGTRVLLRKGSSVSYQTDFGKIKRYVQLHGEAYFEVVEDSLKPFNVKAINEITVYKGTSFVIRNNDSVELVIVSKGEVKLENSKKKGEFVTITAGQKAELRADTITNYPVDNMNDMAWTNEQLIFNHTPLRQVAADIYNLYGIPVNFSSGVNPENYTISAQFKNGTLKQILTEITLQSSLTAIQTDSVILIDQPKNDASDQLKTSREMNPYNVPVANSSKKKKSWIKRIFSKK